MNSKTVSCEILNCFKRSISHRIKKNHSAQDLDRIVKGNSPRSSEAEQGMRVTFNFQSLFDASLRKNPSVISSCSSLNVRYTAPNKTILMISLNNRCSKERYCAGRCRNLRTASVLASNCPWQRNNHLRTPLMSDWAEPDESFRNLLCNYNGRLYFKKKNQYVHIDEMWRFWYLNWQLRMLSLVDVNSPPSVVPPTERPGLAGKVNVHEILLEERGGVIHVTGLRTDVSEHFFTETASQQIVQCWINIMINNNKSWIMNRFDGFQQSILRIESRLVMI